MVSGQNIIGRCGVCGWSGYIWQGGERLVRVFGGVDVYIWLFLELVGFGR